MRTRVKLRPRDLSYIAVSAALMAVCAWITIPGAVPFSLQTFGVFVTMGLLGGRRGTMAVLVYILLGVMGLPVFTGFAGGVGVLLGTTGGYIVGFVFAALIIWLTTRVLGQSMTVLAAGMILGLFVCYAFGTAWFMVTYTRANGSVALKTVLGWCVTPFIVPDLLKIALALFLTKRLKPVIQ